MVDQPGWHVENVMENQPERHVDNMVDQPERHVENVDSLVHVVDQPEICVVDQLGRHVEPETSIHADTQSEPPQESSKFSKRSLQLLRTSQS
ncbi:hypothetical protein A2U01_0056376, partial [Trifolium medium]|nr:hypothetical protein [Trifolium medium]